MSTVTKIDDDLGKFGAIVSHELVDAFRQNMQWLYKTLPVGGIHPIMTNLIGSPDPNIWQECNGSQITNPNSPLRSIGGSARYTPNLTSRFLKITNSPGQAGATGGISGAGPFPHAHVVEPYDYTFQSSDDSSKGIADTIATHEHTTDADWGSSSFELIPPFFVIKYYMKIQ